MKVPALLTVLVAVALAAAPAVEAHIQVRPAQAAPEDPVLWTVLVPNERDVDTTRVELAIPEGVTPFAYEPLPGWTRKVTKNPNQSARSVVWIGRLKPEEVLEVQFLATTPPQEGPISWKAIQTYTDGQKVRWIGGPDSEEPASVTEISASAPRENAGGEAGEDSAGTSPDSAPAEASDDGGEAPVWLVVLALGLGASGLAVGGAALVAARRRT